jgi:hypothetical protein
LGKRPPSLSSTLLLLGELLAHLSIVLCLSAEVVYGAIEEILR